MGSQGVSPRLAHLLQPFEIRGIIQVQSQQQAPRRTLVAALLIEDVLLGGLCLAIPDLMFFDVLGQALARTSRSALS